MPVANIGSFGAGDGFSPEISSEAAKAWQEAKELGYEGYKKKLVAEGKYRQHR
jgi:hypothetical protein